MARRYETLNGSSGWSLARCEERLLITFYEDIQAHTFADSWRVKFTNNLYTMGSGVPLVALRDLNSTRARPGLAELRIEEIDTDDYARNPDEAARVRSGQDRHPGYRFARQPQPATGIRSDRDEFSNAMTMRTERAWSARARRRQCAATMQQLSRCACRNTWSARRRSPGPAARK
jgi:hypothetical protein